VSIVVSDGMMSCKLPPGADELVVSLSEAGFRLGKRRPWGP
jgi:hypothetical protein